MDDFSLKLVTTQVGFQFQKQTEIWRCLVGWVRCIGKQFQATPVCLCHCHQCCVDGYIVLQQRFASSKLTSLFFFDCFVHLSQFWCIVGHVRCSPCPAWNQQPTSLQSNSKGSHHQVCCLFLRGFPWVIHFYADIWSQLWLFSCPFIPSHLLIFKGRPKKWWQTFMRVCFVDSDIRLYSI